MWGSAQKEVTQEWCFPVAWIARNLCNSIHDNGSDCRRNDSSWIKHGQAGKQIPESFLCEQAWLGDISAYWHRLARLSNSFRVPIRRQFSCSQYDVQLFLFLRSVFSSKRFQPGSDQWQEWRFPNWFMTVSVVCFPSHSFFRKLSHVTNALDTCEVHIDG